MTKTQQEKAEKILDVLEKQQFADFYGVNDDNSLFLQHLRKDPESKEEQEKVRIECLKTITKLFNL